VFEHGDNDFNIEEIVDDPKTKEVFGDLPILAFTDVDDNLVVTPKLPIGAFDWLDRAQKEEYVWSVNTDRTITPINMHECYYSCLRPQKLIVGCLECAKTEEAGPADCQLKRLLHVDPSYPEPNYLSPSELLQQFKSRKTTIAGYTFVSPRLTADEAFPETFRPAGRHDFGNVEDNSTRIKDALKERKRVDKFIETECWGCLVADHCGRTDAKYCRGAYAQSQKKAEQDIVAQLETPYSKSQLEFLINHTGRLKKRYEHKIYYATLEDINGGLIWGLRRKTHPHAPIIQFKEFKQAKNIIEVYGVPGRDWGKVTPTLLSSWMEMSDRRYSPCNRGDWRKTSYPRAYIERTGVNRLTAYFSWSSSGKRLPWSQDIDKLQEVFRYYRHFNFLCGNKSNLTRR